MGGNSHNTGILALNNFLPTFYPATEKEMERILGILSQRILGGRNGKAVIATNRFPIDAHEGLLSKDIIEEVNDLVTVSLTELGDSIFEKGSYIIGEKREDEDIDATIISSGPMLYFAYGTKKDMESKGYTVRLINVNKFGIEDSDELSLELGELLPSKGPIFSVWDGEKSVLSNRVAAAAAYSSKNKGRYLVPIGLKENTDANGTIFEIMESYGLTVDALSLNIRGKLESQKQLESLLNRNDIDNDILDVIRKNQDHAIILLQELFEKGQDYAISDASKYDSIRYYKGNLIPQGGIIVNSDQKQVSLFADIVKYRGDERILGSKGIANVSSPISSDEQVGGIDLNEIDVDRQGGGVDIQFDPLDVQAIIDMGITGFAPVIINITPLPSVLPLLGLAPQKEEEEFEISSLN